MKKRRHANLTVTSNVVSLTTLQQQHEKLNYFLNERLAHTHAHTGRMRECIMKIKREVSA